MTWSPKQGTANGTTTIGQIVLGGILINKTLVGTLVVRESGTAVGTFAIGTVAGTYWNVDGGIPFAALSFVSNSAADDFSIASSAA